MCRQMNRRDRAEGEPGMSIGVNALLCLVFFASGCASLLFETLWFRQTGLLLGNSVWASSLVTAWPWAVPLPRAWAVGCNARWPPTAAWS